MRFKANHTLFVCTVLLLLCVLQCEFAASYKTEIEITPAPPEDQTTKKSGWFSRLWGGGDKKTTTTTTTPSPRIQPSAAGAQRPPPLAINPQAPLVPLGPRPDTPLSSPYGAGQQPPQWPQPTQPSAATGQTSSTPTAVRPQAGGPQAGSPQAGGPQAGSPFLVGPQAGGPQAGSPQAAGPQFGGPKASTPPAVSPQVPTQQRPQSTSTASNFGNIGGFGAGGNVNAYGRPGAAQPNLPPGFAPYQPPRTQPSGLDLSYGGGARPQSGGAGRPGFGLAPLTSTTTTTSTTTSTTTTTTAKPQTPGAPGSALGLDMRNSFGVPSGTTTTRRPYSGTKEDFPPLPTPRTPGSATPTSPLRPSSPSGGAQPTSPFAWGVPGTPTSPSRPGSGSIIPAAPTTPTKPGAPVTGGGNGVSFVPHVPGPSTTVRPGSVGGGSGVGAGGANLRATDDEIRALTEQLYAKEQSLLNLMHVNPQGKTRSIDSGDEAPKPLFEVEPRAFENPTVAKMRVLFDNYEEDTLTNEHVTVNERREENEFVDAVMSTQVMRQAMLFLQNKGIVTPDPKTHRDLVKELWFTQYSRGQGRIGSSGFEHVFVHEVKNGTLIGLHNWVYFADEEKAGRLDYKGYLSQIDLGNKAKVLKVRFTHNGVNKPVNGVFAGTTPELEMALYTVCFQLRPDSTCPVSLGNQRFGIVTYTWRYRGKHLIGSAFPEI